MRHSSVSDIDAHVLCLNDSETIRSSLLSLVSNGIANIVVVDGGSADCSIAEMSGLPVTVLESPPGIQVQTLRAMEHMHNRYTFQGEADQIFPKNFLKDLLLELENSGLDVIQGRKYRNFGPGFFAKGQSLFHRVNQPPPGPVDFISGPQLWRTSVLNRVLTEFHENSYSSDTSLAEIIRRRGVRAGIGETLTEEVGHLNYRSFVRRMKNYGEGDYEFFRANCRGWSFRRRMASVFHVLKRYGVSYPVRALRLGHPLRGLIYFWMILVHRYFFWCLKAIRERAVAASRLFS